MLDGFQSDVFRDIVEAERGEIDRQFSGFTFFANHIGAFPTTIVSIPAMLTGSVYRNQEPMRRYIDKQFQRASLFGVMRDQGYQVDAISGLTFDKASATNFYRLPTPYVTYEAYTLFAAWQLADLVAVPALATPAEAGDLQRPVLAAADDLRPVRQYNGQTAPARKRRGVPRATSRQGCAWGTSGPCTSICTSAFPIGRWRSTPTASTSALKSVDARHLHRPGAVRHQARRRASRQASRAGPL